MARCRRRLLGLAVGALAVAGPGGRPAGRAQRARRPAAALLGPLLAAPRRASWRSSSAAATWPAWRARAGARRRRSCAAATSRRAPAPARAARARPRSRSARASPPRRAARWLATVATIAVCAGVVTLMLALASLLERLRDDPGHGRQALPAHGRARPLGGCSPRCGALPGVAAPGARYSVDAADSFRLGEPLRLVAYPGDHTRFEAPPLAAGRRLRGPGEAEVGRRAGRRARACGRARRSRRSCRTAARCASASAGVVRGAGERRADRLGARPTACSPPTPGSAPQIAIRLTPGADRAKVARRLSALGAPAAARSAARRRAPARARASRAAASE